MLYMIGFKNLLHLSLSSQSEVKNRDCASLTYMFPCFMSAACFDWSPRVDPGFSRGGGRGVPCDCRINGAYPTNVTI